MRDVIAMASRVPELAKLGKDVVVKAEQIRAEAAEDEEFRKNKMQMAGITAPMGFFDPFGFSTDIDGATLRYYREAELKHGRFGMLASLGMIAGEKFSPMIGYTDTVTPAAKLAFKEMPQA